MPQSLFCVYGHMVFSTKNRAAFLTADIRPKVHVYMAGILRNLKCHAVNVGGTEDHVHIVCRPSKFHAPAAILASVKKDSSKWAKTVSPQAAKFQWQRGYGLFSVSPGDFEVAKQYVANQEEHHRKMTFQEDLRRLLRKHNVPYDERYVWD